MRIMRTLKHFLHAFLAFLFIISLVPGSCFIIILSSYLLAITHPVSESLEAAHYVLRRLELRSKSVMLLLIMLKLQRYVVLYVSIALCS